MATFHYAAVDASGRSISGAVAAEDSRSALAQIRALGYFPTDVREVSTRQRSVTNGQSVRLAETARAGQGIEGQPGASAIPALRRSTRVSRGDISLFARQLADLVGAGLPMHRALTVLVEQADSVGLRQLLESLRQQVQEGRPLSDALADHPRRLSDLFVNMIRAGEASGHLPQVLTRLAEFLEASEMRRSQVVSALTYPALLILVAIGAVTFLMTYLVPRLTSIFQDLQQTLPPPTLVLIAISHAVREYGLIALGILVVMVLALRRYARTESGQMFMDRLLLNLPIIGSVMRRQVTARFARTLGTLLAGGVPILGALEITAQAVSNKVIASGILSAREAVREGRPISEALANTGNFLPVVVHMAGVGQETGNLPQLMMRVAESLDFEVDMALRRRIALLEPAIIIVMGAIVGFIVLSILLPILQINRAIR